MKFNKSFIDNHRFFIKNSCSYVNPVGFMGHIMYYITFPKAYVKFMLLCYGFLDTKIDK